LAVPCCCCCAPRMAELDSLARLKKRRENNRATHYWCGDQVHSHIPRIDYIRRYIAHTHTHTHSTRRCRNSCHVSINMRRTPQQQPAEDPTSSS
jgi:hypothetical protein